MASLFKIDKEVFMEERDLVKIAKRENNKKRGYLVVNPLQGKHIPVSSTKALEVFSQLGSLLKQYDRGSTLLVGFAETATAIGAQIAIELGMDYVQTTRENVEGASYFAFEESHSHATEQKLVKDRMEKEGKYQQVIFVEDEVTTGNTILSAIDAMEKLGQRKQKYAVASILNGMDGEALARFESKGISVNYLAKTNHSDYQTIADSYQGNGDYHIAEGKKFAIECINIFYSVDPRRWITGQEYQKVCEKLWEATKSKVKSGSTLVLGTEECMYPALYIAKEIEKVTKTTVRCHATTRSPIMVSKEKEYPLHQRWELPSLYEKDRKTFVYDLTKYDQVLIVTDAENPTEEGIAALVEALYSVGNENVTLVRWCRK